MSAIFISDTAQREFGRYAQRLYECCGVRAYRADITGNRWSYVEGIRPAVEYSLNPHRFAIDNSTGVVLYGLDHIPEDIRKTILTDIRNGLDMKSIATFDDILKRITETDSDALYSQADSVRRYYCGEHVHLRGLIEFSNYCSCRCAYCGLHTGNTKIQRYRMSSDEILATAITAHALGCKTVVLQSGEDPQFSTDILCRLIEAIKKRIDCALTLCIGERSYRDYQLFRQAGADRYLLRFETSDEKLFKILKPHSSLEKRLECISWLKALGYQVGSGMMVGIPGQTAEILARDILLLKELDLDMIGLGPFIAHPDTLYGDAASGTLEASLKALALTRIVTRATHIPATTAFGSIDPAGRQKSLCAGANVIMPNVTPQQYRQYYQIYPNKISAHEDAATCVLGIDKMLHLLDRPRANDYGHGLKRLNTEKVAV